MATVIDRPKSDTTITMRVPTLIDSAAAVRGKSRTDFIVECARLHAVDVLLDQRISTPDAVQSEALADALANLPKPVEALRALMAAKDSWA